MPTVDELLAQIDANNKTLVTQWAQSLKSAGALYRSMDEIGRQALAEGTIKIISGVLQNEEIPNDLALRFVEPPPYRAQPISEFINATLQALKVTRDFLHSICQDSELAEKAQRRYEEAMSQALAKVCMLRVRRQSPQKLYNAISAELGTHREMRDIFTSIAERLAPEFLAAACIFATYDDHGIRFYASNLSTKQLGFNTPLPQHLEKEGSPQKLAMGQDIVQTLDGTGADYKIAFYKAGFCEMHAYPLMPQGRLTGILVLLYRQPHPITEADQEKIAFIKPLLTSSLRLAERTEALTRAEQTIEKLFNDSPNMLCAIDYQGRIARTNTRFRNVLGVTDDVVGIPFSWLVHPDWFNRFSDLWTAIQQKPQVTEARIDLITAASQRLPLALETHWLEGSEDPSTRITLIALWNISKHLEQARAHEQQIDQLNAFSHHIAHDLRAPLRTIASYAGMLREDLPNGLAEDIYDEVDRIEKAATRGDAMISGMLQFASSGPAQETSRPVKLTSLIQDIQLQFAAELQERHGQIEITADETLLLGHTAPFETLLANLIGNALRYSPQEAPIIRVSLRTDSPGWAILSVQDEGIGIATEDRDRIFELFQRADVSQSGSGIGLAIVRRIAHAYGGEVSVQSELGQGSTFSVRLPTP